MTPTERKRKYNMKRRIMAAIDAVKLAETDAEALKKAVAVIMKGPAGRPRIGAEPMTAAERMRRCRAKKGRAK